MKIISIAHFILIIFFGFVLAPLSVFAEEIDSFVVDITLQNDGTFAVVETIAYDFEEAQRHGIFRDIEKNHPQAATSFWKNRSIAIAVDAVALDGTVVPYELSDSSNNLNIKIGDPNVTITGLHTYTIAYTVHGGLSYFDENRGEIYWNVTGDNWEVPIQEARATVYASSELFAEENACYKGPSGVSTPCDGVMQEEGKVQFHASDLASYEGLTIAQALHTHTIETLIVERFNIVLFIIILLPLCLLSLIVFGYKYRTHFKTGAPIIAQYEPYKDFKPMYAGTLLDGNLDPRDITAGIVYLAEQGFIKIKKIDKKVLFLFEVDDYEIDLLRPRSETENSFLQDVLVLLFGSGSTVGAKITLGELKNNTSKQVENYALIQKLRRDLKTDMRNEGFYQVNTSYLQPLLILGAILFGLILLIDFIGALFSPALLVVLFGGVIGAVVVMIIMYERRTAKGYEAQDHLKGFKLFLSVTDKERFAFHNAPQKSPEQFMEFLPYAIAFGVEKQWAEAFEGITIPNPDWYEGGSVGSFSAVHLTSSLGAFSTSFAASSGSSGSSGGGSSGGGGGGGGGGSW